MRPHCKLIRARRSTKRRVDPFPPAAAVLPSPIGRVAWPFTGADVAHAHARGVPIHPKGDTTSMRYVLSPEVVRSGSDHLRASPALLAGVRREIAAPCRGD